MNSQRPTISLKAALKKAAVRGALSLSLCAGFLANAQSTNDSDTTATDYDSFQIIVERNIFNPDRYPHGVGPYHPHHELPTFSLAGTMSYRKGLFAFFSGSSDDYQKILQQGGAIAGYTVAKISFDGVQLKSSGKTIDMKVGASMRLEGGEWVLSESSELGESSAAETPSSSDNSDNTSSPAPASSSAPNDILKRLMEQRQQELK